ncbi:MAG: flagellar hook-length control protein FliK, partial [Porcipelethomonas sp.]
VAGTQTGGEQNADYMGIVNALTENLIEGQSDEQQYYPVIPQNETYMSGLNFGLNDNDNDIKISDFSENIISADPVQLSGLLGVVMTGNSIPDNSGIISTLYKEMSVNTDSFAGNKTTAYDFVNKYIESGELEIVGFTPKSGNAAFQSNAEAYSSEENSEGLMDFYRTMQNAMDTIPSAKKSETAEEPENIGILQEKASELDIRFDQISSDIKMKEEFEAPETQLLKGVEENLKKGNSEFTVKLKPEGLGEIIVKLVQNDGGKMLMSMTASNIKTAELLNSNLSSLQSSLSQHNVEIVNPSDMTSTVMAMTPAFEQYYGQQQGGNQQNQQFYNHSHGYAAYSEVDDAETFNQKAAASVEKSGLDILI